MTWFQWLLAVSAVLYSLVLWLHERRMKRKRVALSLKPPVLFVLYVSLTASLAAFLLVYPRIFTARGIDLRVGLRVATSAVLMALISSHAMLAWRARRGPYSGEQFNAKIKLDRRTPWIWAAWMIAAVLAFLI